MSKSKSRFSNPFRKVCFYVGNVSMFILEWLFPCKKACFDIYIGKPVSMSELERLFLCLRREARFHIESMLPCLYRRACSAPSPGPYKNQSKPVISYFLFSNLLIWTTIKIPSQPPNKELQILKTSFIHVISCFILNYVLSWSLGRYMGDLSFVRFGRCI